MNLSCVLAVAVLAGLLIWAGCGLRRLRSALCQEQEEAAACGNWSGRAHGRQGRSWSRCAASASFGCLGRV